MAKNKDKKKIPFNTFRKGITAGALGLAMLVGGAGVLPGCIGEKGDRGETGATGKSAYELAVEQGFTGTLTEWLASLKGQSGGAGSAGADGAPGTVWKSGISYSEFTDAKVGDFYIDTDDYIVYQKTNTGWSVVMENYGRPGVVANDIEMQVSSGQIQWRYKSGTDTEWKNLLAVSTLTGTNGYTPYIQDGYWYINGVNQNIPATGIAGKEIEIQKGDNAIQWRYEGDQEWIDLVELSLLKGESGTATNGTDGKSVKIAVNGSNIQWRYTDDSNEWQTIISVDSLKGSNGSNGTTPHIDTTTGNWFIGTTNTGYKAAGTDGREIQIQVTADYIQWKYEGETDWTNLIPVSSLKGADGEDGATWISGNVVPTTQGKNGDFYLNTLTYDIYKNTDGSWAKIGNIKGSDGLNGTNVAVKQYGKYTCIGDSISYGAGSTSGNTSWCNYLAEKLGATLTKRAGNGQKIWEHLRTQVERVEADTDLVTVMIGVNDCSEITSGTKTMGEVDEVIMMENDNPTDYENSSLYNHSVLGRFRWCLERLQEKAPNARIIVITPLPYNDNATLKQMVQAQASICNAIGMEVLIPTDSVAFTTNYFQALQSDNLHPNDAGYKVVAGYVYQNLGDVKYYEAAQEYIISTTLSNVSASVGNISYIKTGGTVQLRFIPNSGYELPETISVTGSSYTWYKGSGTLILNNPTDNVTISIHGVEQVIDAYNVIYNINGHGTQPDSVLNVFNLPETLPVLVATGYTFDGWYLDEALTIRAEAGAEIVEDTTLYAKWVVEQLKDWASSRGSFNNTNFFSQENNWNEDVHVTKFCYFNGGEETIKAQLFIYDTETKTITKAFKFENVVPGANEFNVDFTMLASENWIVQVSKDSYWISTPSGGSGIVICTLSSQAVGGTVNLTTPFAQYTLPANLVGTIVNS